MKRSPRATRGAALAKSVLDLGHKALSATDSTAARRLLPWPLRLCVLPLSTFRPATTDGRDSISPGLIAHRSQREKQVPFPLFHWCIVCRRCQQSWPLPVVEQSRVSGKADFGNPPSREDANVGPRCSSKGSDLELRIHGKAVHRNVLPQFKCGSVILDLVWWAAEEGTSEWFLVPLSSPQALGLY